MSAAVPLSGGKDCFAAGLRSGAPASTTRSSPPSAARFLDDDPAAFAHVERDGIWALDWPDTYMSDFH
ncbi:MAG TPA: hypothetical protein VFF79_02075 [Conexibacter sp.]|nr:hypothetical protein [Conexibacter sp.]